MKILLQIIALFIFNSCAKEVELSKEKLPNIENSFDAVWSEVSKDELKTLPQDKISFFKLDKIKEDSKRTLQSRANILPYFDKLAHPNGVCLSGIWSITEQNPYGGYFKQNSKALIIARASSAMSNTKQGQIRAFGLAGKLFSSLDPKEVLKTDTANFFVIDDLGGSDADYFTQVELTNEPKVSMSSEVFKNLLYAIKVAKSFSDADKHSGIRQLYEISYLGEDDRSKVKTPKWMKIKAKKIQKNNSKDFRSELTIKDGKKLIFDISVATKEEDGKKDWKYIGEIIFDNSVVSKSCDHRLHFHHPKFIDDLN
jgi:hypothetical protein